MTVAHVTTYESHAAGSRNCDPTCQVLLKSVGKRVNTAGISVIAVSQMSLCNRSFTLTGYIPQEI